MNVGQLHFCSETFRPIETFGDHGLQYMYLASDLFFQIVQINLVNNCY